MTRITRIGWLRLALVASGIFSSGLVAQSQSSEHTWRLGQDGIRRPATIEDLAWLTGHWNGPGLGGVADEVWIPAQGDAMLGMFRLVKDGKPSFYELVTIIPDGESLVLKVKHFMPDMKAWEEKEKTVDFPLIRVEGETAYFSGLTFTKTGPDQLDIYLVLTYGPGDRREEAFHLTRQK